MLAYLDIDTPFPTVHQALAEPNGLLAAGGDLSTSRLLTAYSLGIFPWYSHEEPILWWSPDPRTVFFIEQFKLRKEVKRLLQCPSITITLNAAFAQVLEACAKPRDDINGTWITLEMKQAYLALHEIKRAHSVEVWQNNQLVGGIYGVNVGGTFCGESMFSSIPNGSKTALTALINYLKPFGFKIIDCQVENPHLMSLGAKNISRENYLSYLESTVQPSLPGDLWSPAQLVTQNIQQHNVTFTNRDLATTNFQIGC
ncbi:leucyl/phenylalanyl-tRNA--protein transferase [Aliikangiella sp. IMCC44653]